MVNKMTVSVLRSVLSHSDVILVDVRNAHEYQHEHIEGSILLSLKNIPHDVFLDKSKKIVLYCKHGMRSDNAYHILLSQYPELNLYSLEGGIHAWKNEGYPTVFPGRKLTCLSRQVHMIWGLLILLGLILGNWCQLRHLYVSIFVGADLLLSATFGCGMIGKVLRYMPWNR